MRANETVRDARGARERTLKAAGRDLNVNEGNTNEEGESMYHYNV